MIRYALSRKDLVGVSGLSSILKNLVARAGHRGRIRVFMSRTAAGANQHLPLRSPHQIKTDRLVRGIAGIDRNKFGSQIISNDFSNNDFLLNHGSLGVVQFEIDLQDIANFHIRGIVDPYRKPVAGYVVDDHGPASGPALIVDPGIGAGQTDRLTKLLASFNQNRIIMPARTVNLYFNRLVQCLVFSDIYGTGLFALRTGKRGLVRAGDERFLHDAAP